MIWLPDHRLVQDFLPEVRVIFFVSGICMSVCIIWGFYFRWRERFAREQHMNFIS